MSYVDHDFYKSQYGGRFVSLDDFTRLEIKASAFVDALTFRRLKEKSMVSEDVKFCVCELMDEICHRETQEASGTGVVKSTTVSKLSVAYVGADEGVSADKIKSYDERILSIVIKHLAHTGLLYRGVK